MKLIKLKEYARLRRDKHDRTISTLYKEARRGNIPGAFQLSSGGEWLVDLEYHDKVVLDCIKAGKRKILRNVVEVTPEEKAFIWEVCSSAPGRQ